MDRGGAGEARDGAVQRRNPPIRDLPGIDVEGGLVELDDVDAIGLERARLSVQQLGERHRHLGSDGLIATFTILPPVMIRFSSLHDSENSQR
jgi:hypothetical protein